jgi:RNA polymerase sigma factor (sigma-70 family)
MTCETDDLLVCRVRSGDMDAYGLLFARHAEVARRVARRHGGFEEAEDVVAEVFAAVLGQIRAGRGPTSSYRAYLLTAIRYEARRRAVMARRCEPVADPEPTHPTGGPHDGGRHHEERMREAYATLPERWRVALWHLEVEGRRPRELAAELGLSPNAVAALGYRARAALRSAYLAQRFAA